jgi:hypothetical protein
LRGKEMNTPVIHPVAVRHRPLFFIVHLSQWKCGP